jgi:hypothetical protein
VGYPQCDHGISKRGNSILDIQPTFLVFVFLERDRAPGVKRCVVIGYKISAEVRVA